VIVEQNVGLLTDYDRVRYHRQMMIQNWGEAGQLKLKSASVFIAGAGGLGSPVSTYVAAAGVGEIRICDADCVELSNLNRQILHFDARIGELKAVSAGKTLRALNPAIRVITYSDRLSADTVDRLVGNADIVVDCLDNYDARFVLNTYCLRHHIPLVHGAVSGMWGQVTFLKPPEGPCLRCIFPQAPPAEPVPVVGAAPGLVGCIEALEVLKYLTGIGSLLKGRLLLVDGAEMSFESIVIERNPSCPDCGALKGSLS
jgi:molybdopterin/thiamine biosynthesis adenylyltransferase